MHLYGPFEARPTSAPHVTVCGGAKAAWAEDAASKSAAGGCAGSFAKQKELLLGQCTGERLLACLLEHRLIADPGQKSRLDAPYAAETAALKAIQASSLGGVEP